MLTLVWVVNFLRLHFFSPTYRVSSLGPKLRHLGCLCELCLSADPTLKFCLLVTQILISGVLNSRGLAFNIVFCIGKNLVKIILPWSGTTVKTCPRTGFFLAIPMEPCLFHTRCVDNPNSKFCHLRPLILPEFMLSYLSWRAIFSWVKLVFEILLMLWGL